MDNHVDNHVDSVVVYNLRRRDDVERGRCEDSDSEEAAVSAFRLDLKKVGQITMLKKNTPFLKRECEQRELFVSEDAHREELAILLLDWKKSQGLPCSAMLCHVLPCSAMLCHALPCS